MTHLTNSRIYIFDTALEVFDQWDLTLKRVSFGPKISISSGTNLIIISKDVIHVAKDEGYLDVIESE